MFLQSLELLISQNRSPSKLSPDPKNASATHILQTGGLRSGLPTCHSACLLLILNNCSYTKDIILPQIHRSLIKLGYPDMSDAIDKARIAINVWVFKLCMLDSFYQSE